MFSSVRCMAEGIEARGRAAIQVSIEAMKALRACLLDWASPLSIAMKRPSRAAISAWPSRSISGLTMPIAFGKLTIDSRPYLVFQAPR